jgi:acyl-CoA thioester hydrolase
MTAARHEPDSVAEEFACSVRVYYEDTDAAGLVYHSNYLKYLERARTDWLRHKGYTHEQLRNEEGVVFMVTRVGIRFAGPGRMDDLLEVRARVRDRTRVRMTFAQTIHNQAGELVCEADVEIASVDTRTGRPRRLPAAFLRELADAR